MFTPDEATYGTATEIRASTQYDFEFNGSSLTFNLQVLAAPVLRRRGLKYIERTTAKVILWLYTPLNDVPFEVVSVVIVSKNTFAEFSQLYEEHVAILTKLLFRRLSKAVVRKNAKNKLTDNPNKWSFTLRFSYLFLKLAAFTKAKKLLTSQAEALLLLLKYRKQVKNKLLSK